MDSLERRREYQRKYREANREKINLYLKEWHKKNRSTQIEYFKYKYNENKPRTILSTIKRNLKNLKSKCKSKGIPFDVSIEDIEIPTHCPLLGLELKAGLPRNSPESPSIDKIIPSLGYVRGNVWVISQRANTIKHNASLEEIEMICKNLRQKMLHSSHAKRT